MSVEALLWTEDAVGLAASIRKGEASAPEVSAPSEE